MKRALACAIAAACGGSSTAAHPTTTAPVPAPAAAPSGPPLDLFASPSLQIQVLLDERLAKAAGMDPLDAQLAVSPRRLAVVSDRKRLYLVGWGGATPVEGLGAIDAFDYTGDGLLLVVRGNELSFLDDAGDLKPMLALPTDGMGIAAGANNVLLFERKPGATRYALYELAPGKLVRRLLESPDPIDAVAQGGGHTYFASAGIAFEATPGVALRTVAALPSGRASSLAVTPDGRRLYISDGDSVYAVEGNSVALVTRDIGGVLRMQADALLVLDPKRRIVARIAGMK